MGKKARIKRERALREQSAPPPRPKFNPLELENADPIRDCGIYYKPGFYYVGSWFITIPPALSKFNKGADIMGCLFRRESEPLRWYFKYRFRHYKVGSDPWDGQDEKNWSCFHFEGTEEKVIPMVEHCLSLMAGFAGSELEVCWFRGDCEKVIEVLTTNPPKWMHAQQVVAE